jgi:pimeloyl-ACP methyl ester carboxylesterase
MTLHTQKGGNATDKPALVLMHFLGGSGREWDEVVTMLGDKYRTLRVDLPGFGGSAKVPGYSVDAMADCVAKAIAAAELDRYILVGHSMSGKVAMVMARRERDVPHSRLAGLVLVAPSPPSPEPISPEKRAMMLELLSEFHTDDTARARQYITKNELRDIPQSVEERATLEVLKMNRAAWVAWINSGSKEDFSARVGVLDLPAVVLAGDKDLSLGPKQQIELTLKHLRRGKLVTVPGCSHLIPMECPAVMSSTLRDFVAEVMQPQPEVPAEYLAFMHSDRVSPKTRQVLDARRKPPASVHNLLSEEQVKTLRALMDRVIPQSEPVLDLTGYVMERLAKGKGDGWRYEVLPSDIEAYREGLDRLAWQGFTKMDGKAQDGVLRQLASHPGSAAARWFEEVRGDAVSAYMAHPVTMARIGYSGIGVGGADTPFQGYVTLGPNEREDWEPVASGI